jgi:dolichyl-phosphate beta-glucosyltransferase
VERLLAFLEDGYDIAIGSREGLGAQRINEPGYRHLMGRVFNLLVRLVAVGGFQDTQCGFKCFRREAAQDLFQRVQLYGAEAGLAKGGMVTGFDVEVLFLALKRGYKVKEVPVQWHYGANTKVNPLLDSARMFMDVLRVRLNDWRGKYN